MKKVLLISFFSISRPGGSFRPEPLAKYLPQFGWQPIILTPFLSDKSDAQLRIIETPYRDVLGFWKRLFRLSADEGIRRQVKKGFGITSPRSLVDFIFVLCEEFMSYPDLFRGWKPFAIKAGEELLQNEHMDAMISCHPVTSHIIASDLKTKYGIPWIADFADLWSQNHGYPYGPIRKLLDTRLELKTLSQTDALVTVSQPWAEKLRTLHKGKSVYAITHGFDPAEANIPPVELTAKFTITYTGRVYTEWQDPSKLFAALQDMISDGTIDPGEIEIRFYGFPETLLEKGIKQYKLSSIIKQYGRVPKQIALEKQRESQLLLLLKWENPQQRGVYTSKVFEYLGARRPILATGGYDDVVTELLDETHAGIHAPTVEDIKSTLKQLYREYKLKGEITYKGKEAEINKYSHQEMARKFSEVLDRVTSK